MPSTSFRQSLRRLWALDKFSYSVRVFIALTGSMALCWYQDEMGLLIPLFLGIIASALAETDDSWQGRLIAGGHAGVSASRRSRSSCCSPTPTSSCAPWGMGELASLYDQYYAKSPWHDVPHDMPVSYKEMKRYAQALWHEHQYVKSLSWMFKYMNTKIFRKHSS